MTPILYWSLLLITFVFAMSRGRHYERVAAFVCLAASVLTLLVHQVSAVSYVNVERGDLMVDIVALAAFVTIALKSDRFWPLWVAGLQLITSFAHFLKAIAPTLIPQAYSAAERFWSYPILLIVLVGAWRSHRRHTSPEQASPAVSQYG